MRCGLCGNENADTNYYCGMCGGALVRKNQAPAATAAPVGAPGAPAPRPNATPVDAQVSAPSNRAATAHTRNSAATNLPSESREREDFVPAITGPSFLGLNVASARRNDGRDSSAFDPAERNSVDHDSRARPSHRDSLRPSGSVDYLLEDEEEPKRGWGKRLAMVIALALLGGLGYLRWQRGGFDWVLGNAKPAASEQTAGVPAAADQSATPDSPAGASAPAQPLAQASNTPPASDDSASQAAASTPAAAVTPVAAAAPAPPNPQADSQPTSAAAAPPAGAASPSAGPAPQPAQAAASAPPAQAAEETDSDAPAPADAPTVSKRQQRKPTPAKPLDSVSEAERYIYGNGVRQDCDRGLRLLKPAAQANAKAMIALGTLYSTGTCTPRDLPTAYRWFAMALHKEPDNLRLQNDLQNLWSQMTQPERQLAIKLSQ